MIAAAIAAPVKPFDGRPALRRYCIASKSPVAAAVVIVRASGLAPLATRSFKAGVDPKVVTATPIAVAPRLLLAFTSAPASSKSRIFARLVAAFINAVEPTAFIPFTLAPLSIRSFIICGSDSRTACIKAVVPPSSAVFGSAPARMSF